MLGSSRPDRYQMILLFAMGNSRTLLPVAAYTALQSAGINGATPGSPTPAGAGCVLHGRHAGTNCLSIFVHRACPTKRHAATELGSRELQLIPQIPEQGHSGISVEAASDSIYFDLNHLPASLETRNYPGPVHITGCFDQNARTWVENFSWSRAVEPNDSQGARNRPAWYSRVGTTHSATSVTSSRQFQIRARFEVRVASCMTPALLPERED